MSARDNRLPGPRALRVMTCLAATLLLPACAAATTPAAPAADVGTAADPSASLTVYAAASLNDTMTQISEAFTEAHPGWSVEPVVYDGSSSLATHILEGAPADVFVSADEATMTRLSTADALSGDTPIVATNTLTIAVAPGNPHGIAGLADLARADLTVVQCAPEVPCGAAAATLLTNAGVSLTPASEEQSVSAVVRKVQLGEADAGLVYRTDVAGADGAVDSVAPPGADAVVNSYPAAVIAGSAHREAAEAFVAFLLTDDAQSILRAKGFVSPS